MFVPYCIIDARKRNTKEVIGTVISLIKQTAPPAGIKIIVNTTSRVNLSAIETMLFAHDGPKIVLSRNLINDDTDSDYCIVDTMKHLSTVQGIHRTTKVPTSLKISHVILMRAGQYFMSNKVIYQLMEDWNNGIKYDVMLFKLRKGQASYHKRSAIFYLDSVKRLCTFDLWQPFIYKQEIFNELENHITTNYYPIRICQYGFVKTV